MERVVDVRVVDQAFPAHRCARFFQVGPHDDEEGVAVFFFEGEEAGSIVEGGGGVVDGAGAYDDEEPVGWVGVLDYGDGFVAGREDSGFGGCGLLDLMLKDVGGG